MVSGQFPPKKIAPSPVRVTVWFRVMVRIRVGGGAIFLGGNCPRTTLQLYFTTLNIPHAIVDSEHLFVCCVVANGSEPTIV